MRVLATVVISAAVLTGLSLPSMAADVADLYKSKCAACHGVDGSGETPAGKKLEVRDLRSADVQKQSDAELNAMIANGKKKMPAYSDKLSAQQIQDLVKYIRNLKK
ncbi:MAG TPA: cytochrome c [Terriglobales bacterium]|nr:cytochrome c [Terriglobales bacterium]